MAGLSACPMGNLLAQLCARGAAPSAEPPVTHWCSPPTWCSRKEVIDALGYRFTSLCREKLLLFGDKHHHPGHLVEGCLSVGKSTGQESIPHAELHVVVLQRQERHEEINEVLFEEVAAGITALCSKKQGKNFRSFI